MTAPTDFRLPSIPAVALSVRQPWAWAIVTGRKDIENRSRPATLKGGMQPMHIAIHAAKGMTEREYEEAREFMLSLNVLCPRPDYLVRGAIIGMATVTAVVDCSDSPWFFGPRGLVLTDAATVDPIPATGALGYFAWSKGGTIAEALPWMKAWPRDNFPLPLFQRMP